MTTRYLDYTFGVQGVNRVWASGTPSAVGPGDYWYQTIEDAITAADDGDTIKVAPGSYALPALIGKSLLIAAYGLVTFTYTPPSPIVDTVLDPYCVIDDDVTVRFKGGEVTAPMGVKGSLVLDGQTAAASGKVFEGGSVVGIGPESHSFYQDVNGAYERYDSYYDEGRWPSQFGISNYRNAAVLEAPAKFRGPSGEAKKRWVPIGNFRYLVRDGTGDEKQAGAVDAATQGRTFFTKPGLAAHQDMRITSRNRRYNIVAVSRPSGPGLDLRLTVTEYTGL